jgi:hypothetical protein
MGAAENRSSTCTLGYSVIAGLEAGILGGLMLLTWLLLVADWRRQSAWSVLNLFGGTFYPDLVFRLDFTKATLPGLALSLFLSGCVGAFFGGAAATLSSTRRQALFGLVTALCWHYFSFALLWRPFNPALFYYGGRNVFLIGHLLFGAVLGLQPHLAALLAKSGEPEETAIAGYNRT